MSSSRNLPPIAAGIARAVLVNALTDALVDIARKIKERDGCSDEESIRLAMLEYDRIVAKACRERNSLEEAQERTKTEAKLREEGKPTLKVSLGDLLRNKKPSR
jgi:hypothetical protein